MLQGLANNVDNDQIATYLLGHIRPNIFIKPLEKERDLGPKAIRQSITRAYMHAQATIFCLS